MRRFMPAALCALALVTAADALAQDIRWYSNYGPAMEEATRTDKPLLVSFRCVP